MSAAKKSLMTAKMKCICVRLKSETDETLQSVRVLVPDRLSYANMKAFTKTHIVMCKEM